MTRRTIEIPEEIREFLQDVPPVAAGARVLPREKARHARQKSTISSRATTPRGSHKLNSAIAQAYYAKKQGLKGRDHRDRRRPVGHGSFDGLLVFRTWTARSTW